MMMAGGSTFEELKEGGLPDSQIHSAKTWEKAFKHLIERYDLGSIPIDVSPINGSEADTQIAVSIACAKIIDVDACDWNHLIELRKDKQSMARLRRFRLFAFDKYQGMGLSFIEDDLLSRMDDYNQTVAEWGLNSAKGVIVSFVKSKGALGSVAAALVSEWTGSPVAMAAAFGAGALGMAEITLDVVNRGFELQKLNLNNPVSYIAKLDNALKTAR
jgi:hypothetical protein